MRPATRVLRIRRSSVPGSSSEASLVPVVFRWGECTRLPAAVKSPLLDGGPLVDAGPEAGNVSNASAGVLSSEPAGEAGATGGGSVGLPPKCHQHPRPV